MSVSNRVRVSLVVGVALAALAAAVAVAATSHLTINAHNSAGPNGRINGDLTSSDPSCVKGTRVKLHHDVPGKPRHFIAAGRDATDKHGRWVVRFENAIPPGKYYASVAKDGLCPAIKTTTIKVTPPH